jgi:hypothetical protein
VHVNSRFLETGAFIAIDIAIVSSIFRNTSKTRSPAGMMDLIMQRCKKYGYRIN